MKKIIILTDNGKPRYGLVQHHKTLFPECEIRIFPRYGEGDEEEIPDLDYHYSLSSEYPSSC
jgi:hypothetical protein